MVSKLTYERLQERDVGLGAFSERAMRAVVEALFAHESNDGDILVPPAERVEWVTREIDDFLARASRRSYALIVLSLVVVALVAPLFVRRVATLSALSPRDRILALDRFERSSLSPALLAVKALACVHYYEHPDAAHDVGFDGACLRNPAVLVGANLKRDGSPATARMALP